MPSSSDIATYIRNEAISAATLLFRKYCNFEDVVVENLFPCSSAIAIFKTTEADFDSFRLHQRK